MLKIFFILAIGISFVHCDTPTFACNFQFPFSFDCIVREVHLSESQTDFTITAPNVDDVRTIKILDSHIPKWNKDLCATFPNLMQLYIQNSGIEEIAPNSFDNCVNLMTLHLDFNRIKKIEDKTFEKAVNLAELVLNNNNLTEFSAAIVRKQQFLNALKLQSNFIFDIDEAAIIGNCPRLQRIELNDNNFNCWRMMNEIRPSIGKYGVHFELQVGTPRVRSEKEYARVKDFYCLSNEQWNTTLYQTVEHPEELLASLMDGKTMIKTWGGLVVDKIEGKIGNIQQTLEGKFLALNKASRTRFADLEQKLGEVAASIAKIQQSLDTK